MSAKAELRYIDGEYYVTQGDKKMTVSRLIDSDTVTARAPGTIVKVGNLTGETLYKAACFLTNFNIEE